MSITRREFLAASLGVSLASMMPGLARQTLAALPAQVVTAVQHGRRDLPLVCLTYDDLWEEPYALQIAQALAEQGVKATFFPAGLAVRANLDRPTPGYEDLYPRIYELGHEFGCHTYSHIDITDLTAQQLVQNQIQPWVTVMNEALGFEYQPVGLRPPMGIVTDALFDAAYETDLPIVLWGGDLRDSFCAPEACEDELLWRFGVFMENGKIYLQHANAASLSIIERQLAMLDEAGLTPVMVSEMVRLVENPEATPEPRSDIEATPEIALEATPEATADTADSTP